MLTPERIMPVAITAVGDGQACIGSLTDAGAWVRPKPISLAMISGPGRVFAYGSWTALPLAPSTVHDRRPEDRAMAAPPRLLEPEDPERLRRFLEERLDPGVMAALDGERSLGLIRATIDRIHIRPSTGGRRFVRLTFRDGTGWIGDWIVPDERFRRAVERAAEDNVLGEAAERRLRDGLNAAQTLLCLGLTKPNGRFPGRFRGCHPLVVGVHPRPGALAWLEGEAP